MWVSMYVHVCAHASLLCVESWQHDTQESGSMGHSVKRSQMAEVAGRLTSHLNHSFSTLI